MSEYCKNCQRLQEEIERLTKTLRAARDKLVGHVAPYTIELRHIIWTALAESEAWADKLAKNSVECSEDEVIISQTNKPCSNPECRDGLVPNLNDGGYGTSDCPECGGSGEVNDPNLFGATVLCPKCKEKGK